MTKPPAVTSLNDARELKAAGLPVNIPLEHRTFGLEYSEHWFSLLRAKTNFAIAVRIYSDGPRAGSAGQWKSVKRRFGGIIKAVNDCGAFVVKLGGDTDPPTYRSDHDRGECLAMASFLAERALPFAEFWKCAIDAVDDGTPLTIRPGDIPKWIDDEET
jgi:hypothetical protein